MNTERPLSRRTLLGGALAAAAGLLMPASNTQEKPPQTPKANPPEPPTSTPEEGTTGAPSKIPIIPPTTRAAEAGISPVTVVAEAPPTPTERQTPVVTAAPTAAPTETSKSKEKETVVFQGSPLTRELLDGIFVRSGTGGGDFRTPTPDTGGIKTKPVLTDVDYMASVWSFQPTTVSEIMKTATGALKLAASGASQIGIEGSTYKFRGSEVRLFGFQAQLSQSIPEIRPPQAKPEGVIVKRGAKVAVLGTFNDSEGKSWTAVSIADHTREDRPDPHLFFTILPTFQEADSSKWSLQRLVEREGFGFDKASATISFEGDGKSYQWQVNTLDDELRDAVIKEAGLFWIEKTTNPIVPYPASNIIEKLAGKAYQFSLNPEGVPIITSEGKELTRAEYDTTKSKWVWKEIPEQPKFVRWPITEIQRFQEAAPPGSVPPLVAFWLQDGGVAEVGQSGTGSDMLVVNMLPKGAAIRLPIGGEIIYSRSSVTESLDVKVRPDLIVGLTVPPGFLDPSVKRSGFKLPVGAVIGEVRNDRLLDYNPKLLKGQVRMFVDKRANPQTKDGSYPIDINKSFLRDEQGNIVTFGNP